jgi:hypothetical protein
LCVNPGIPYFLVAPLNTAFTFIQPQRIAVFVAHELHFDMSGFVNVLLDQHSIVTERTGRLLFRETKAVARLFVIPCNTHACNR